MNKMIRLELKKYQGKLDNEKLVAFPTEHYYEDSTQILLYFKSREKIDYYTIISKKDIIDFSENINIDMDEAINFFKLNYCSNHLKIEDIQDLPLSIEEIVMEEPAIEIIIYDEEGPEEYYTSKSVDINAGEDIIVEAEDYSDFLLKTFDRFEKLVLSALDKIYFEKAFYKKSFGDFLRNVFNSVNTALFAKHVKKYLKADLVTGLVSSEAELGIDIGFTNTYEDKLEQLMSQQINGYTINGKKWFGIKGVTKEIQADVIRIVQNGINEKKGLIGIKKEISEKFSVFSDYRSEMISRTETNNIINEGKLLGYKESGLKGKKVWDSALDNRTSEICRRLDGQERDLDDDFIDPETFKAYHRPSAHPHCRSVLRFKPD